MIKLEAFSDDADVTFVRNNFAQRAFVGNVITPEEFDSLVIKTGIVTYSVDELQVITVDSTKTPVVTESEESTENQESTESEVTPAETTTGNSTKK